MIRQNSKMRLGGKLTGFLAAILCAVPAFGVAWPASDSQGKAKAAGNQVIIRSFESSRASKSFLGVNVREIDPEQAAERAKEKNLPEEQGVEITSVISDSAAEKAGLKKGDVVLEYQSRRVEGVEQFVRLVRETPVGRNVTMKLLRDGAEQTLTATMGSRKGTVMYTKGGEKFVRIPDIRMPDIPHMSTTWRSAKLGIMAESLEGQLAEYFGVKEGVLVRSVMDESPAEKAGFQAGDVIVRVRDVGVATPREVTSAIREMESNSFPVTILRNKQRLTLDVTLEGGPEQKGHLQRSIRYTPARRL